MTEWFSWSTFYAYSAACAGALWGLSFQPDFATITFRAKVWRYLLAVLAAIFTGPYVLHRFFQGAHLSEVVFWMFAISTLALGVGPILARRVMDAAKSIRISILREDK